MVEILLLILGIWFAIVFVALTGLVVIREASGDEEGEEKFATVGATLDSAVENKADRC